MPTSDAAHTMLGDPIFLLAASALAGLAVGLMIYVGCVAMSMGAVPATAVLGDAQRSVRRRHGAIDDPLLRLAMSAMPVVIPMSRKLPLTSVRASLAQRYAQAGWPGGLDDDEVLGIALLAGLVLAVLITFGLLLTFPVAAPAGLIGVILGPSVVSGVLSSAASKRTLSISRTMPFVLDLIVLTMRAGAALTAAMERVAEDFADDPIGIEFKAVLTDLDAGVTMRNALESLARRVQVPLLRTMVDDVIQSQELGRPVADTLARLSDRSRTRRVQDAVDSAGRAKVMVLIPGVLILFASLIVLFSPFIVRGVYGGYGLG